MLTLKLLLFLAVLGWSLYSAAVYWSRRGDNKQALRTLQTDGRPERPLSLEESVALAPFLFEPSRPGQAMPLRRDGVFVLHGEYVRHGLTTGQGGETMHDTIGGVEVILPYDARDFLEPTNRAEVVFTEKFALVVGLNGSFDLLGGRARALRRQQQDQQWQTGKAGEVPDVAPMPDGEQADTVRESLRVEILGQRAETPAEVAARSGPGVGLVPALLWVLAFVALGIASVVDPGSRMFWFVPACGLAVLAVWWVWGRRRAAGPGKVNRVRGHVTAIALPAQGGTGVGLVRWFVGDKFPLELPAHWQVRWATPPEGPVDVEMRVDGHTAVRFGRALSIDDEVTRFSPVHWGRHALLAVVGAVAVAALPMWADDLPNDLVLTSAWIRHGEPQSFDRPDRLAAQRPAIGTPVHLFGQAECDWRADPGHAPRIDCTRLRWGAAGAVTAPIEVDALTRSLHEGDFLHARSDPRLELMLQLQLMGGGDPLARYQASANAPKLVTGLADLVRSVEAACATASGPCDTLRTGLVDGLMVDDPQAPKDWAGWVRQAASGELTGDRGVAVMRASAVSGVLQAARAVADQRAGALVAAALAARQAPEAGVVLLDVLPGGDTHLPPPPEETGALAFIDQLNGSQSDHLRQPFDVDGLLVGRHTGPGGATVLQIDALRRLGDPWPSLMRAGWLALGLGLLVLHGVLFGLRFRAARGRSRAVGAFIDERWPTAAFLG
ncbi:IgaA/UmoB family intracellular growth attenuator [Rhizobacter sp. Root1221]|uniref:IgaA/UmoB family intracellular growth attenuator n=1 Tax=Rhizobacter sp. Root1221 TaxID=1736433 RepID=UPI0006F8F223|nr:IgaA/UmoB family intracellular growth attenuator [Rhizobacter sp. Root1221]KQV91588.1 hypothetical protein ASC87_05720 [Rhizobacter sp. Root1221]